VLGLVCSKAIGVCSRLAMPWTGAAAGAVK